MNERCIFKANKGTMGWELKWQLALILGRNLQDRFLIKHTDPCLPVRL